MEYRDRVLITCIVALTFSSVEKFYYLAATQYVKYGNHDKWMSDIMLLENIDLWCTYIMILSVIGIIILGLFYDPVSNLISKHKSMPK